MEDNTTTPTPSPTAPLPPTGESSSTPKSETPEAGQQKQPLEESEEHRQLELPKILEPVYAIFVRIVGRRWGPTLWIGMTVFLSAASALVTLLWTLALWDSYRPKITVTPGPTFNPKDPFATIFIIQNQGALPIRKVSFDMTWTYADSPNQMRNVMRGVTQIAELQSLEQHAMINPLPISVITNQLPPSAQIGPPMPVEHHSLVMWFDVAYDPKYFWKKTATLYFVGAWDAETNFQWLPTGSIDIRTQTADAVLLKRSSDLFRDIERRRANAVTNSPTNKIHLGPTNDTSVSPTNGGAQVHTN